MEITPTVDQASQPGAGELPRPVPEARKKKLNAEQRIRQLVGENRKRRARIAQLETLVGFTEQDRSEIYAASVANARAQHEDFDAVVENLRPLPPEIIDEIQSNEGGAMLAYQMGKFPALHYELASLNRRAATHRIRRLCVELLQQSEQQTRVADAAQWYRSVSDQHFSKVER